MTPDPGGRSWLSKRATASPSTYHDFYDPSGEILPQHYAFLVAEHFDEIFGRIQAGGQDYWADPGLGARGEINHNDGGHAVYFHDPDKHLLEIITRPYGSCAALS